VGFAVPSALKRRVNDLLRSWDMLYKSAGDLVKNEYVAFQNWRNEFLSAGALSQMTADGEYEMWRKRYAAAWNKAAASNKQGQAAEPGLFRDDSWPWYAWVAIIGAAAAVYSAVQKKGK